MVIYGSIRPLCEHMPMKEIKFYKILSGKSPIEDFLDSLSSKEAQKLVKTILDFYVLNIMVHLLYLQKDSKRWGAP